MLRNPNAGNLTERLKRLKENGLEVIETIMPISARLIANKASFEFRKEEILGVMNGLRQVVEENDIPDVIARFNNLAGEESRTRKDKSFLVPVKEIRDNDYVLSMNKYKEVEREVVEYEKPDVILGKIESLETEISEALKEFRAKFL